MAKKHFSNSRLWKRTLCIATASTMVFSMLPSFSLTVSAAPTDKPDLLKAGSVPVSSENYTLGGPFPKGTAGCDYFRIPNVITLDNGDLLATADARYQVLSGDGSSPDGGGIDTIASVSSDGGKTWYYSFPIYFPDSNLNAGTKATTIIDPGVVKGPDGTIYCIADANPTGVTTMNGYTDPGRGTGYIEVKGKQRLALTSNYSKVNTRPDSDGATYEYYVGDLDEDGFAPVLNISDNEPSDYCVDEWFNIYKISNGTRVELKQKQVDSDVDVQQNAFYKDSDLHVYNTGYMFLVTSTDNGHTWGNPTILNPQIKRSNDTRDVALLVSPGKGTSTKCGDIAIGFYNSKWGNEAVSIVYSTDNGTTWQRTSDAEYLPGTEIDTASENELVELEDGTLRMFFRHGGYQAAVGNLCYVDAKKQADGSYEFQTPVVSEIPNIHRGCKFSALSYSKKIKDPDDGVLKQAILIAAPSGVRANGQIVTLLVNNDDEHTLKEINRYSVPGGQGGYESYVYSCLTELEDGSIGLLWEPNHKSILYSRFNMSENGEPSPYLAPTNVEIKKDSKFTVSNYEGDQQITTAPDEAIAAVTFEKSTPYVMFDHTGSATSDIQAAFSASPNDSLNLSDAEFVFTTGSDADHWIILNTSNNWYLANTSSANFYADASAEMLVKKTTSNNKTYFQISKAENSRVIFFYPDNTNFNSQTTGLPSGSDANLLLLEKQSSVSDDDIIPGYQQTDTITSGKSYLIAYMVANGKILVLYPNKTDNFYVKTKLVIPGVTDLVITGIGEGYTKAVVDNATYEIHVTEDHPDPDPDCEHTETTLKNAKDADCENNGYSGDLICNNCNAIMEQGTILPGGHDWDEGTITKAVSLTEDGTRELTCKRDATHKKTEIIYSSAYALFIDTYTETDEQMEELEENWGMYEDESAEALQKAYEAAKEIAESGNASRAEMYNVKAALAQAQAALTPKSSATLKEELDQAVAKAEPDAIAQGNIPNETWIPFKEAYDNALEPIPDDLSETEKAQHIWNLVKALQATQKDLDDVKDTLAKQAIAEARSKLSQAVTEYKNIYEKEKSLYTTASWSAFETAYNNAKNPPENADLDKLNTLLTKLNEAKAKLVKASGKTDDTITLNDVTYKILNESNNTAIAVACAKKDAAKITIAASVSMNNKSYTVVQIDAKAFSGCTKLKQVTIGQNVTTIGSQCFSGCKNLKKVILKGTKLKTIKSDAFKKTSAKMTVKVPKKLKAPQRKKLLKKMKKAGISKKAVIK